MALLACPFCREMYEGKERTTCPVCGVALAAFTDLPRSYEGLEPDEIVDPIDEPLPWTFAGRQRGLVVALSALGLALFFLPWIHLTLPETVDYTGYSLARRLGWAWGGGVAWFVLLPTVFSRRTIRQLRGARVAAAFLSAFPGMTAIVILLRPPHSDLVPVKYTLGAAIFATLATSVAAVIASIRLGGRVDVIAVRHGSSHGEMLH